MAVDVEGAGHLGGAALVGDTECAVARGVQDAAVRQDREGHGLACFFGTLGKGHLLKRGGGGLSSRVGGGGRNGAEGRPREQGTGQQCEKCPASGTSLTVHESPPEMPVVRAGLRGEKEHFARLGVGGWGECSSKHPWSRICCSRSAVSPERAVAPEINMSCTSQ
ncbi:hypothetical protein GCM10011583_48810 [Streptomyces camponoticapitis]|uniref:Uncharacterized protein n=1 Tax=Streptomyces camponoticapitis TaxID=1616125 RepID=A0ABQ2EJH9_9ACTN|nr:hypothetical protein GCM10011583_48810 [Streptomyces camponoticapitis]